MAHLAARRLGDPAPPAPGPDKANHDITWLRDASLEDLDDLPFPEVIAREIVEDLAAAGNPAAAARSRSGEASRRVGRGRDNGPAEPERAVARGRRPDAHRRPDRYWGRSSGSRAVPPRRPSEEKPAWPCPRS
jgi:hypothetical protein